MESLPSSIEASLEDAGFSATEILILKRLLEEDALTLRNIALKTGKSTGVLDQAMKKLLKKGIVTKETINAQPKFVLQSLQSIVRWMEKDMADKQEMLERRHKNFETFIATLAVDKGRPEMEHFEGEDGIKKAYAKLLDQGKEMLVYMPATMKEEDDPLRDFLVQYFRERRSRGILQRVITHDTPLGRRFQARDMFEYRKTVLIKEEALPIEFQQIIIGDTVACIDYDAMRASFIRYPHLAQSERAFFETLWNHPNREITIQEVEHRVVEQQKPEQASLKTRVVSAFREFILSRRSVAVLAGFAVVSAAMTFGLYSYTLGLSMQRMKEQVRSIAATGASQFNPADLNALQTEADWRKPEWAKVVGQLRDIRVHNEDLLFAYIIRQSSANPEKVEFVADSHSLNPFANADDDHSNDVDTNGDGMIDSVDYLQWPGQAYSTAPEEAKAALKKSTSSTNEEFYEDHWGKVISGYAPIRDQNENVVAVLAVDMEAKLLGEFTSQVFQPIAFFLFLFAVFVVGRFAALHRPLLGEVCKLCMTRKGIAASALVVMAVAGLVYAWHLYSYQNAKREMGERFKAVAASVASEFSAEDIAQIHWARDMKTDAYQRLFSKLNEVRNRNPGVKFAYIMRPTDDRELFAFVADADVNFFRPEKSDLDNDGDVDYSDELTPPGMIYDASNTPNFIQGWDKGPLVTNVFEDLWGEFISSTAPIYDSHGNAVAFVELDFETSAIDQQQQRSSLFTFDASLFLVSLRLLIVFLVLMGVSVIVRFAILHPELTKEFSVKWMKRRNVLGAILALLILLTLVYAWQLAAFNRAVKEAGERLKVAVAVASKEINSEDIARIHWARDMKTDEYQRLFTKLNDIRNSMPNIEYASILRPTSEPELFAFVADADTNYFLPSGPDLTFESTSNLPDELVPPGMIYNISSTPQLITNWKKFPMVTNYYTDVWGTFISASAPIHDRNGTAVAMLNVSQDISKLQASSLFFPKFTKEELMGSLKITAYFVIIFGILTLIYFVASHRLLSKEVGQLLLTRKVLTSAGLAVVIIVWIGIGLHWYLSNLETAKIGERLKSIAATAADEFNPEDIEKIHWAKDMKTEEYQRLFAKLNEIRNKNPGIKFAYILRPTTDPDLFQAVADADSNYALPYYVQDFNGDGKFNTSDAPMPPGLLTQPVPNYMKFGLQRPYADPNFTSDQWGTYISGYAPIRDKNGKVIALFGVDVLQ